MPVAVWPAAVGESVIADCVQATWAYGYWLPDMSIECFTGWHLKLVWGLGIPLLLLCCLAIPLLPVLLLYHKRRSLTIPTTQSKLGFLYKPYRY